MEMKLTPVDFSHRVAEGSRSSWLQIIDNELIDHFPYCTLTTYSKTLTANITYFIPILEYVDESRVNRREVTVDGKKMLQQKIF